MSSIKNYLVEFGTELPPRHVLIAYLVIMVPIHIINNRKWNTVTFLFSQKNCLFFRPMPWDILFSSILCNSITVASSLESTAHWLVNKKMLLPYFTFCVVKKLTIPLTRRPTSIPVGIKMNYRAVYFFDMKYIIAM